MLPGETLPRLHFLAPSFHLSSLTVRLLRFGPVWLSPYEANLLLPFSDCVPMQQECPSHETERGIGEAGKTDGLLQGQSELTFHACEKLSWITIIIIIMDINTAIRHKGYNIPFSLRFERNCSCSRKNIDQPLGKKYCWGWDKLIGSTR